MPFLTAPTRRFIQRLEYFNLLCQYMVWKEGVINLWRTGIIGHLAWHPSIKLQECDTEAGCRPHRKKIVTHCVHKYRPHVQDCLIQHTLAYQLATCEARGWLVLRLLCVFHICIYLCASALITCAIIMSRTLLLRDLT